VPARLTGRGYDGHYFWDTEVYVQPFLVATQPALVRELLSFRHRMLPAARRAAGLVSENGALFPWRTINGEEASAYYSRGRPSTTSMPT
jgi:alpha,alpha-trehalose phosphorylase